MNNFKFYALTRFKLEITASACFNELRRAHYEAAPSRATVFRWFSEFKDDGDAAAPLETQQATVTVFHAAQEPRGLQKRSALFKRRSMKIAE